VQVDQQALAGNTTKARLSVAGAGKENAAGSPRPSVLTTAGKGGRGSLGGRSCSLRKALATTTNTAMNAAANDSPKVVPVDMDKEAQMAAMVCSLENKDACLMCGS
jgi:hypothetical protein